MYQTIKHEPYTAAQSARVCQLIRYEKIKERKRLIRIARAVFSNSPRLQEFIKRMADNSVEAGGLPQQSPDTQLPQQ
ncbi:MAG TPA: hypothetical protein VMJ32_12905 [Pirellulales bacterium]|nr:hypothetical protein [Pirellulales bacterium]